MISDAWMDQGKCRTTKADPAWFYPEQGQRSHTVAARNVCAGCPVNARCLQYALDNMGIWEFGRDGIWGGTTPDERKAMLRQTGPVVRSGRPKSRVA